MIALVVIILLVFFPWRLETEGERRPLATGILVVILAGLHLLLEVEARRGGPAGTGSFLYNWFTYGVFPADFRALTLFTSQLLHGDIIHLLGNAWILWVYGQGVERKTGPLVFLAIFVLTGAVANLAYLKMVPSYLTHIPTIGASAGISGILGFVLLAMPASRVAFLSVIPPHRIPVPAFLPLLLWFGGQLFAGFTQIETEAIEVNHWVHIFGFLAGVLGGLAWKVLVGSRVEVAAIRETVSLEAIVALAAGGRFAEASTALDKAIQSASHSQGGIGPRLQIERARIAAATGAADAREALRLAEDLLSVKAHGDFLQAYVLLEALDPAAAAREDLLRGAGNAYAESGNAREALRCWLRLLSVSSNPETQERLLFQIARHLVQKLNQPEPARACLKALLAAFPSGRLAKEAEFMLTRQLAPGTRS